MCAIAAIICMQSINIKKRMKYKKWKEKMKKKKNKKRKWKWEEKWETKKNEKWKKDEPTPQFILQYYHSQNIHCGIIIWNYGIICCFHVMTLWSIADSNHIEMTDIIFLIRAWFETVHENSCVIFVIVFTNCMNCIPSFGPLYVMENMKGFYFESVRFVYYFEGILFMFLNC